MCVQLGRGRAEHGAGVPAAQRAGAGGRGRAAAAAGARQLQVPPHAAPPPRLDARHLPPRRCFLFWNTLNIMQHLLNIDWMPAIFPLAGAILL